MSETFNISPSLLEAFRREGLDTVAGAFAYAGGHDMTRPGLGHRHWVRLRIDDAGGPRDFYMKRYLREPLSWRLRRLLTYGPGKSPAGVEFENIRGANAAGLKTISQAIFGEERVGGRVERCYVIVSAVPGAALEQCGAGLIERIGGDQAALAAFTAKLADLARRLHQAGWVHRDFYSSHIFLDDSGGGELYLIDLARMFQPRRQFRWRVKDLAQLKYSMPPAWVRDCWGDFLHQYAGESELAAKYARAIDAKAARIGRHDVKLQARRAAREASP